MRKRDWDRLKPGDLIAHRFAPDYVWEVVKPGRSGYVLRRDDKRKQGAAIISDMWIKVKK